jgi:hypothetical protein
MPKISELTTVASPLSTDTIPLVEAGATKKATLASLPVSDAVTTALALKTTNSAAAITGGTITGITDLAVADGGTGASTAIGARTNLGAAASGANTDITSLSAPALGAATATTAANNDSSTKVATTAFVNPANSIADSGYQKLPSGLIIQWGIVSSSAAGYSTFDYPIAFTTAVYSIVLTPVGGTGAIFANAGAGFSSLTQCDAAAFDAAGAYQSWAVAYHVIGK